VLTEKVHNQTAVSTRLKDYAQLTKFRLSSLVVFSAVTGYLLGADQLVWRELIYLIAGGFLVTGASNGINQVIERNSDPLMDRTKDRPMAQQRLGVYEATIFSALLGLAGVSMLWFGLNELSGVLAILSFFLYTAIYTPLKKITPFAVFVGAIPGAIPPMLGYVAATGTFGLEPGILFMVQFMWQFPHFWAIAWRCHDDYKKAGINLLPSRKRDKSSAFQIMMYTLVLVPVSLTPIIFGISGIVAGIVALVTSLWFFWISWKFFRDPSMDLAKRLMFASFIYLPVVQIIYVIG